VQVELLLLVGVVMVLGPGRLAEPEQADLIARPERHDHGLQARRVVEVPLVVAPGPVTRRLSRGGHEAAERVVLGDARAQRVEARVGDEQRERGLGRGRGVADERVEEVRGLAHVHGERHRAAVRVAAAPGRGDGGADGAVVEDVGVDEGEPRRGADVAREARHAGVVEADDEVVRVDLRATAGPQEDAAVPDHGARRGAPAPPAPSAEEERGEVGHGARDVAVAASVAAAREEEAAEGGAEGGEEGVVAGDAVERDAETGHGPLPRRGGGVAAVGDAQVQEAVVVADAGEGGHRRVGQQRGRLGQDLVPADVGGRKTAEERVAAAAGEPGRAA